MVWLVLPVSAQTGGQFCVRAFEDRNADGVWAGAASEPLLMRDVAINLLNADGVVINSGLMESSRTAAQGIFCFQFLPAGQYTAIITSADLTATTPMSITATVNAQGEPVVVEYGAQRNSEPASASAPAAASDGSQVVRVALSAGGAAAVMVGMGLLGAMIYTLALRRAVPAQASMATGLQRVRTDTKGQ